MNQCYRTVWSAALGVCVAVAENVRAPRGGMSGSVRTVGATAAIALATLAASGIAQAATFTASNEAQLITAINAANASTDPSSTITFTGGPVISSVLPQIQGHVSVITGFAITIRGPAGATLDLQGGATFGTAGGTSGNLSLGNIAGTTGTLIVQGSGTAAKFNTLTGTGGQANIRVLNGGSLRLGVSALLGTASVAVSGTNSAFDIGVGYTQQGGTLEVSNGATLESRAGVSLGATASFTGVVTGAGSKLATTAAAINLGTGGPATLTVADGAVISANSGNSAVNLTTTNAAGSATLNIGAAAGSAAVAPGTVIASAVNGGAGTAVLNFNHNASAYDFSVPITGNVTVNQLGSGTTTLTGASTYTGPTNVSAGTLAVNGSITSSVNVLAAGRLQGSGSIGGATVAGTIAPGNSIGTLSIAGNLAQSAGSVYEAEVDPASNASDLIHASGSATLASGSQLKVVRTNAATFGIGNRYTVLSADGGITGTYQLAGDTQSAFVRVVDSYDANNVYLTVEKTRAIASVGGTGNETAVGGAIDSMPAGNALSTAVTWLPNDVAARDALNQLSADIHASTRSAMLEDSRFVREAAIDRLRSAACAPGGTTQSRQPQQRPASTCTPEADTAGTGWAQVFGSWGHIDSDGNASKLDRDIGGFMVGADTAVGAGWRAGGLIGYSRSNADTSARNSDSKTDSYHLAIYGGTQWDATALRLGLGHSWNHVDTERSVAFPGFAGNLTSDYDSGTTQAFAEVGHRIDVGRAALEPFAGLAYVSLGSSSFSEQGGPAALYGQGDSLSTTFSTLGVRASMPVSEQTRLRGMLGWRHAFGDTSPTTTQIFSGSLPFTLSGLPLAEDVAALEAGVETQLRPNLTLSASYSGQFGGGLQDHGAKVELNWTF